VRAAEPRGRVNGVLCPYCNNKIWDRLPLPSWYKFCTYCGRVIPVALREVKA